MGPPWSHFPSDLGGGGVHFAQCHGCLGRTFCALYGTFCTWLSRAYILRSIRHFLHMAVSDVHAYILCPIRHFLYMDVLGVHFVLYTVLYVHHTVKCTFYAENGSFCTSHS